MLYLCIAGRPNGYGLVFYFLTQHNVMAQENKEQTAGRDQLGDFAPKSREQVSISNVTFEPRCRNNWHVYKASHGGGQMLIGVAGRGWYQEAGHCAVAILPGTVVHIPANTKHRHDGRRHLVRPPGR